MPEKDADWRDKAKQYLRAEKKQLEEEEREAEIMKQREKEKDSPSAG